MAKGNLFLGMGRGSVGDVTFYRADGQQLSRARNRKPRNPKSNAQLIQRAISATIVQAYKAGSIIFDHSFEGKSVPAGSQRAFLSVNMRKLREHLLAQIDLSDVSEADSSVVSPRATYPVPNSYRISEGSLIQKLFEVNRSDGFGVKLVSAQANETVAQFLSRIGVSAGEIYTVVEFGVIPASRNDIVSGQCTFGFMRLTVKETAITSAAVMSTAKYVDLFEIDSSGAGLPATKAVSEAIKISEIDMAGSTIGSMGVIRSNENSGLRSTSEMWLSDDLDWGVAAPNLLTAWSDDNGSVDSELILEGGQI